jgi:hypothetical protein
MLYKISIVAFILSVATLILAAPVLEVNIEPSIFPSGNFTAMMDSQTAASCPGTNDNCGVVTFNSGQYVSFGQGICMPLGKNVQSIYVARCYCSLWK